MRLALLALLAVVILAAAPARSATAPTSQMISASQAVVAWPDPPAHDRMCITYPRTPGLLCLVGATEGTISAQAGDAVSVALTLGGAPVASARVTVAALPTVYLPTVAR